MKKAPAKGCYGYRDHRKKIQLLEIAAGVGAILLQLAIRSAVSQESVKNVLTIMAILSVLPTANVAAPFLAALPYRTPDRKFYDQVKPLEEKFPVLCDLIITTRETVIPMDVIIVHHSGIYCCCSSNKIKIQKAEEGLNALLKAHRNIPHLKIIADEKAFFRRASSLKAVSNWNENQELSYAVQLLKNLSM